MALVVHPKGVYGREDVVDRSESEQPLPGRQDVPEAGVLGDNRAAGGQVTGAASAEPATLGGNIAAPGNAEFGPGALNELLVSGRRGCDFPWVYQAPTVTCQGIQIFDLLRVNRQRQKQLFLGPRGQGNELAQRMGFLTIEDARMFNGAIAAPVTHRGQSVMANLVSDRPAGEHDRLRRPQPAQAAGRHGATGLADALADRHKLSVSAEAHVDTLHGMPELREARVEVEIDTGWNRTGQFLVREHASNVDQDIRVPRRVLQMLVTPSRGLLRARQQQRRILPT